MKTGAVRVGISRRLGSPLTVQLTAATGQCWEAVYSTLQVQTAEQLKAKAD